MLVTALQANVDVPKMRSICCMNTNRRSMVRMEYISHKP